MSKGQKPQVKRVRLYQKISVEIDYDKLAEALSNAQNQQNKKHSGTREWMKVFLSAAFWTLVVISAVLGVLFVGYGISTIVEMVTSIFEWPVLLTGIIEIIIGISFICVCAFSWVAAKEIDEETDRQYIASMFSNIVALVALIVALIALVKG